MRKLCAVLIVTAAWMTGGEAPGQGPAGPKGDKYALLVGVRQYETPDLRALRYPESDVEELAKVLIRSGYRPENVKVMTQRRGAEEPRYAPVAAKIRKELALILRHLDEGDSVVVALAGHGVQFQTEDEAYFCPADAQLNDKSTMIALGSVYDALKASDAGFKLLLVDACRNNPMTEIGRDAGRPVVEVPSLSRPLRKKPPGGVAALFSCSTGERAFEHPDLQHGVFFHFVIKALEGEADRDADGKVDLGELTSFATRQVFRFVETKLGVEQNPEFVGKSNAVAIVTLGRSLTPASPVGDSKTPTNSLRMKPDPKDRVPETGVMRKTLTNLLGMKLILIPAGEFLMGSEASDKEAADDEKPKHKVRITRPFYLGSTEVTVGQFRRFAESERYRTEAERDKRGGFGWNEKEAKFSQGYNYNWRSPGFAQDDDHPVVNVTWNDSVAFCQWLGKQEGQTYRLPTEAEWEYSCRAGTTSRYWFGDEPEWLAVQGNVADGSAKKKFPDWMTINATDEFVFTAPVGRFRPNPFGLFDVHGNVGEWCSDLYQKDYYAHSPEADPLGPIEAMSRVTRGGSWGDHPRYLCRSAVRNGHAPSNRGSGMGFRVVRTL